MQEVQVNTLFGVWDLAPDTANTPIQPPPAPEDMRSDPTINSLRITLRALEDISKVLTQAPPPPGAEEVYRDISLCTVTALSQVINLLKERSKPTCADSDSG